MKKVRIYEIARLAGVDNKSVLELCKKLGINATNHSSTVDQEQADILLKQLTALESEQPSQSQQTTHSFTIIRKKKREGSKSVEALGSFDDQAQASTDESKHSTPNLEVEEPLVSQSPAQDTAQPKNVSETKTDPVIKVLGKLDINITSSIRQGRQTPTDFFEPKEPAEGKKPLRFKEAKTFAGFSLGHQAIKKQPRFQKTPEDKSADSRQPTLSPKRVREIKVEPVLSVGEFAQALNLKVAEVIQKLLSLGEEKTINDLLDQDTMALLAEEFGYSLTFQPVNEEEVFPEIFSTPENVIFKVRPPVVTVMGHVDHGKTTLLDTIRKSNVASKEAGGITQHLGAYTVYTNGRPITFLDTPGHEAFSEMRARGASVTDIVVLVVAADDGVMPQTLEALSHAKNANVQIIVALNKIDKPEANPEAVKQRLGQLELVPEEWGGDTIYVPISALKGTNIDKLLESILLVADMLELKAAVNVNARCYVLEARQDRGRGWLATVIPTQGILRVGSSFVCGSDTGRVRAILSPTGEQLKELEPGFPGEISGFSGPPKVGDQIIVVASEKLASDLSAFRKRKAFREQHRQAFSLEEFSKRAKEEKTKELLLIIKGDTQGTVDALSKSLSSLSHDEVRVKIIHTGIGTVTESDVKLAKATSAIIIAFNVPIDSRAAQEAESRGVDIRKHKIIYACIEEIKTALEGMLEVETQLMERGRAQIRKIFNISRTGAVAGCNVIKGSIKRGDVAKVIRDNQEIFSGRVLGLKRFKEDVGEVQQGYDCGIFLGNFSDFKEGDVIVVFEEIEVKKSLGSSGEQEHGDQVNPA